MFAFWFYFLGRVAMAMTTLLTLSSTFASLSSVTPPISYTTRLDIWMVTCIIFVFFTLAEFTLVIFLKYYLVNHLPAICSQHIFFRHSADKLSFNNGVVANEQIKKKQKNNAMLFDEASGEFATAKNGKNPTEFKEHSTKPPRKIFVKSTSTSKIESNKAGTDTKDEELIVEEKKRTSQTIIKKIEKYSVVVFFVLFLVFNGFYWHSIVSITNNLNQTFEKNSFKHE